MRLLTLLLGCFLMTTNLASAENTTNDNAYDFSFHTLVSHQPLPLASFRGKVLIIVNTASKCGFTPQYASLEKLYEKYKDKGLVILGVPSNDFAGQEPGTDQEIVEFCKLNYGVSFPMTSKEIVSGKNAHPFYLWARKNQDWVAHLNGIFINTLSMAKANSSIISIARRLLMPQDLLEPLRKRLLKMNKIF